MMLALGDAFAVVLAKRKGFSSDDFKIFHPGGKIGASFTKVGAIMHKDDKIPIVSEQCLMSEALITMTEKSLGCLAVIGNQGELAGMITDGDLRRHLSPQLLSCKANEVMTPNPITISPNILVAEALNIMSEKAISNLLVIEDKSVIGVLALKDCLRIGAK
jgi:arabinose-5-phosphate isomerase